MSDLNEPRHDGHDVHGHGGHDDHGHGDKHYIKVYGILLVLLMISILGPEIGIKWLTLITAFGIAFIKAGLVIKNFMHLNVEKAVVKWLMAISLVLLGVFAFGAAPDIMKHSGSRWVNDAAMAAVARGIPLEGEHGEGGEGAGGEGHEGEEVPTPGDSGPAVAAAFEASTAFSTTCALCHGTTGGGDGVGGAALDPKPANFTDPAFWEQTSEAEMFNVIKNGGAAAGKSAAMAPWGSLYTDEQINQLIEHIKTFR